MRNQPLYEDSHNPADNQLNKENPNLLVRLLLRWECRKLPIEAQIRSQRGCCQATTARHLLMFLIEVCTKKVLRDSD